jgi:la-related protein 1
LGSGDADQNLTTSETELLQTKDWFRPAKREMAATTSPALPAFSYAQAAKGLAPASSSAQSQTDSSLNTPDLTSTERKSSLPESERLESLHNATWIGKKEETNSQAPSKATENGENETTAAKPFSEERTGPIVKPAMSSTSESKQISESTSPSLVASVATLPREDESSATPNGSSESWDKQSETSGMADKPSAPATEGGKEKGADDDWVNVPPAKFEKELKAAPVPIVNIWQQRKEAQEAKAKANAALRSSAGNAASSKGKVSNQSGRNGETQVQDEESRRRFSGKLAEKGEAASKKRQPDDIKPRDDGEYLPFLSELY